MMKAKMIDRRKGSSIFHFSLLRIMGIFSIGLFLLIVLLTTVVVVPKINNLLESQHAHDIEAEAELEAALFTRFIDNYTATVQGLASSPSIARAVMSSHESNSSLYQLLDNTMVNGEKSRLVLQNIDGDILIKTVRQLNGNYTKNQLWFDQLTTSVIPYHFQLLTQYGSLFTFKISVPIIYNNNLEGVLSSEITVPLDDIFIIKSFNRNVAFKLEQEGVTINVGIDGIQQIRETPVVLNIPNVNFTYIIDDALFLESKRSLDNTILLLFLSFGVCFFLLAITGYRSLVKSHAYPKVHTFTWKTYSLPIIIGLIGATASIAAFMFSLNVKDSTYEKELIVESKQIINAIQKSIAFDLEALDAIKFFYDASAQVSRNEFSTFVTPLLLKHRNIQAVQWIPLVLDAQRGRYEQQAINDGISQFFISEKNANGELIKAEGRDSYYPVYYAEPMKGNAIGFDLGSSTKHLSAINNSITHASKIATTQIPFMQELKEQSTIVIFDSIYKKHIVKNTAELSGLVSLELNVENLIRESSVDTTDDLLLYIEDVTETKNTEKIYGELPEIVGFSYSENVSVAGRYWNIKVFNQGAKSPITLSMWFVLISGLVLSSIISLGMSYLIYSRNIVEQRVKVKTSELQESEEQYRAVVENAVDGLLTIDELGTIEKFNQAAQRIFGYSAEEVIGTNIKILMPEPYHGEHDGYLKNYRDSGIKKIIGIGRYVEGKRKDGSIFPIDLSISEMIFGDTKKFSGIVRDVSERVKLEKERENFIDKLVDSNEELERFAFVCSHDLQEPLRMVRSFSEKLREHISDRLESDEKGKKYFDFVLDGAERAQNLISDILSYSSISNNTQVLESVNVEEIITLIINNLLDSSGEQNYKVTFDPLPILQGNKTQLFQLFQNLINNGLKYQKPGDIPHVHIGMEESESEWVFSIKDNGIGMEERHFKKIFEVFKRLHRRNQYAGTGIGLSICKKVVERHGGTIWVESEKGLGSIFYVKLLKSTSTGDI